MSSLNHILTEERSVWVSCIPWASPFHSFLPHLLVLALMKFLWHVRSTLLARVQVQFRQLQYKLHCQWSWSGRTISLGDCSADCSSHPFSHYSSCEGLSGYRWICPSLVSVFPLGEITIGSYEQLLCLFKGSQVSEAQGSIMLSLLLQVNMKPLGGVQRRYRVQYLQSVVYKQLYVCLSWPKQCNQAA